jgi:hypothetical protein
MMVSVSVLSYPSKEKGSPQGNINSAIKQGSSVHVKSIACSTKISKTKLFENF